MSIAANGAVLEWGSGSLRMQIAGADSRARLEGLEYDFHLAPGIPADSIVLEFSSAGGIEIDSGGDLVLRAGAREIRHSKPLAWQLVHGAGGSWP